MTIGILEEAAAAITTDNATKLWFATYRLVAMMSGQIRQNEYSESTFAKPLLIVAKALAKHDVGTAVKTACFAIYNVAPASESLRFASEIILQNVGGLAAKDLAAAVEALRIVCDVIGLPGHDGKKLSGRKSIMAQVEKAWIKHLDALAERDVAAALNAAAKADGVFRDRATARWTKYLETVADRDLATAINIADYVSCAETGLIRDTASAFLRRFPSPLPPTDQVRTATTQAVSKFVKQFG